MEMTDSREQAVQSIIHISSTAATYTPSNSTVQTENGLGRFLRCTHTQRAYSGKSPLPKSLGHLGSALTIFLAQNRGKREREEEREWEDGVSEAGNGQAHEWPRPGRGWRQDLAFSTDPNLCPQPRQP